MVCATVVIPPAYSSTSKLTELIRLRRFCCALTRSKGCKSADPADLDCVGQHTSCVGQHRPVVGLIPDTRRSLGVNDLLQLGKQAGIVSRHCFVERSVPRSIVESARRNPAGSPGLFQQVNEQCAGCLVVLQGQRYTFWQQGQ